MQKAVQDAIAETKQKAALENERLRQETAAHCESEQELRAHISKLLEEISKANKARDDAEITACKNLLAKEKEIREEAIKKASEDFNTKIREQDETINRLHEQLIAAKQTAEQGSQQLRGEILELDIEEALRLGFPTDTIEEVKKGERGSDIRHVVNSINAATGQVYTNCGLILYECKNAKTYQDSWLSKLKEEIMNEKAQAGVIVFNPGAGGGEDFERLSDSIWLVKPRYAIMLATLLREAIVKVFAANRAAEGKDEKLEMVYKYLIGGEFSNRIRSVIEAYDELWDQLNKEKKATQKRWAAQEKILQKVTSSLCIIGGNLQGIAGKELIALPAATGDENEDVE